MPSILTLDEASRTFYDGVPEDHEMHTRQVIAISGAIWLSLAVASEAQTGLPSLEEAARVSQGTGRPIFAVAGQET